MENAGESDGTRVKALHRELAACHQDNEALGKLVDRLQKELGAARSNKGQGHGAISLKLLGGELVYFVL